MNPSKLKKLVYYGLPILGLLFCLWYIKNATCDIVYSDYIRIVNKYLPNVWEPKNFFRPDVLTRIPINYLERPINVRFFNYSTSFEMALGAVGLCLSALVLAAWCDGKQVGLLWFTFLMYILFGLNKWEMLTNGTGWVHFLAFACFYFHYVIFDRVLYGRAFEFEKKLLLILPPVITLGIAGPYCAVYSAVMILAYGSVGLVSYVRERRGRRSHLPMDARFCLIAIVTVVIPLLLYIWSDSYAIEDHDGALKISLMAMILKNPGFFPVFLIKSMASMVVGEETLNELVASGKLSAFMSNFLGVFLGIGYLAALILHVRHRLYERTMVPLMLLFAGMGNHAIVLISRYIFNRTEYGMSSRYMLQYQAGLLGIILTFALVWQYGESRGRNRGYARGSSRRRSEARGIPAGMAVRIFVLVFCAVIFAGHSYTNYRELQKAPYREAYGENIAQIALQYESVSDDVIRETFDYRKGRKESAADVRRALWILETHGWNIYGKAAKEAAAAQVQPQ